MGAAPQRPGDVLARTLVRRLVRRDDPDRGRWAVIAAVWVHLAGLGLLALCSWTAPTPPRPAPVELTILVPVPAPPPPTPPRSGEGARPGVRPPAGPSPERATAGAPGPGAAADAPPAGDDVPAADPVTAARVRVRVRPPTPVDPVAQLRSDLGWAAIDRDHLPEASAVLSLVDSASPAGQGGVAEPDVVFRPAADVAGSELGDFVEDLERRVLERWSSMNLDPHARALGIQGDVTVRYRVRRNGATTDVRVVRSSGIPGLDGMAVRSIPPRVGRLPATYPGEELQHEVRLRYRNP